jgi:voltage-gated potassium channel
MSIEQDRPQTPFRGLIYDIIFLADTRAGRLYDLILIWGIVLSVLVVIFDSVQTIHAQYGTLLLQLEWIFTILFTSEYLLRIYCSNRPWRYMLSFFGIIDLIAIAPTYISLLIPGAHAFLIIRILRVLRIFRILKLTKYLRESRTLTDALWTSRRKIGVFLFSVVILLTLIGSLMYLIEGEEHGFSDIPTSIYWAIVTLTTVGYGDISPQTSAGRVTASLVMILGYSIIAVPTGIVTAELSRAEPKGNQLRCRKCANNENDQNARFCKLCGEALHTAE